MEYEYCEACDLGRDRYDERSEEDERAAIEASRTACDIETLCAWIG